MIMSSYISFLYIKGLSLTLRAGFYHPKMTSFQIYFYFEEKLNILNEKYWSENI